MRDNDLDLDLWKFYGYTSIEDMVSKKYQRQRAAAYPSIADQLDTIYHEGIDAWKLTILAVKEEFPK